MKFTKPWKYALLLAALAAALSACNAGGEAPADDAEGEAVEQPAPADETPAEETPAEETPAADDPAVSGPAEEPPAGGESKLAEKTELEVTIEGMTEKVPATIAVSDQGYAIYVMDGFEFTPEEPGLDQVFFSEAPEYFFQIRQLGADANLDDVKANALAGLKATGDPVEMKGEEIHPTLRDEAKFFLHASTSELSRNVALLEKDGARFLVTMNLPNGEAAEGVTPRFFPMIDSIVLKK
jgi:hypothetical protein